MKYAFYVLRENYRGEMLKSEASKEYWLDAKNPKEIEEEVASWIKRGYELISTDEIKDWGKALYFAHKEKEQK